MTTGRTLAPTSSDRVVPTGATNPYLFVVGAARSGTTLLQRMLDAHPALAVVNETYWIPRKFRERTGLTRSGFVTDALVDQLLASPKFDRMGLTKEDLIDLMPVGTPVRYEAYVSRLFDRYAGRRKKQLAGDKTPGYVRRMPQLHELFPAAKFLHIIRDPRDVCVSMLDWPNGEKTAGQFGTWQDDPVTSTALYWRLSVGLGCEDGTAMGPDLYREVRYEDLVENPAVVLSGVCEFLGLPYDENVVRFHEGRTRIKPGRSSKAQWLPPTPGLRNWSTDLAPDAVGRLEEATGDLMLQCGYARSNGEPEEGSSVRAQVARIKASFAAEVVRSGRSLPRHW